MNIYGYFDFPEQILPTFDPGLDVNCPVCENVLRAGPIKTISLILEGDSRSYFYRVHKFCYEGLYNEQSQELDYPIIDARAMSKLDN